MRRTILGLAVVALLSAGMPAAADHMFGSISGTVTDGDGQAVSGICVYANGYWSGWGWSRTNSAGDYGISNLEPDHYRVYFDDCNAAPVYVAEWYDDKPDYWSADPVYVEYGQETGGIDAELAEGGVITGTVTNAADQPLSGICVSAGPEVGEGVIASPDAVAFPSVSSGSTTDEAGSYRIGALPEGEHRFRFSDCNEERVYASEWWDDKGSYQDADPVAVTGGEETGGIDAVLDVGGSISGTVTNTDGDPIKDVCASASADDFGWDRTDSSGGYRLGGLRGGAYRVHFYDCRWPAGYQSEYYDDKPDWEDADLVGVTLGADTSGIDAVLERVADLAITRLEVENVPLRTDDGEAGYTGWNRRILVDVGNLGEGKAASAELYVSACPRTAGACRHFWDEVVDLAAGGTSEFTFGWNGAGGFGDYDIQAEVWLYFDPNQSNNKRQTEHYVMAGGTGFGVNAGLSWYGY